MQLNSMPQCLLCKSSLYDVSDSLDGNQIRKLWGALGTLVSESAYGQVEPATIVNLYRCRNCGFRFYDPRYAGTALFYEELMASKSYPVGGLDFDHAIEFAKSSNIVDVLDIGCGEGAFLDLAAKSGLKTIGIELNRVAFKIAREKGHNVFDNPIESMNPETIGGKVDMVTAFQLLEHVPDPKNFTTSALRFLKSGGYFLVAVPSDRRMLKLLDHDPADWPPHHVSRWRIDDLKRIGSDAGLELIEYGANPLFASDIPWAIKLHNRLECALERKSISFPDWTLQTLSMIYRFLNLKSILPLHGPSIYAVFRNP